MISETDLIKLAYTPDLTEGGIQFAVRALSHSQVRAGGLLLNQLRRMVGDVAVELAFRRYLAEQTIPFDVRDLQPFSSPANYDVVLGGWPCHIETGLVANRSQISTLRSSPAEILESQALIPEEVFSGDSQPAKTMLVFAYLLGLIANTNEETRKAGQANQPFYLVHPLPDAWAYPQAWAPLGNLSLKSESSTPVQVEIGGQDANRNFISENLLLNPLTRCRAANSYYSLAYIHADSIPTARLGLHAPRMGAVHLVHPQDWGNIWIYGLEIWLAGSITMEDFRRKAGTVFTGSRVFRYSKTQTKNFGLSVRELKPLTELFTQVKNWEARRQERGY